MQKTILVTSGDGYIGSNMVKLLNDENFNVVTFDDLSNGHLDAVTGGDSVFGGLLDEDTLERLFSRYKIDAVMHFASVVPVGESVQDPEKYYQINFIGTLNLLKAMCKNKVQCIIFSSKAALFGLPDNGLISENYPKQPINPYGWTKYIIENTLQNFHAAYSLKYRILRYFNASVVHPKVHLGERHYPETHLIPLTIYALLSQQQTLKIYGKDYDTPDGTCIRDYIHICDLCDAHLLALNELRNNTTHLEYNLGNGVGYLVLDIIEAVEKVSGKTVKKEFSSRRACDPARLIADSSLIRRTLGWKRKYENIQKVISHAWAWELAQKRYLINK